MGGQFAPATGGQFAPARGGQFSPESGGQFDRFLHYFGEHLLKENPSAPVALVESEKTAIIASVYFPDFVWIAAGSLNNITTERCANLKDRDVTLFPDLQGYTKWSQKARDLSMITRFKVSDLLEKVASEEERKDGLDLADYLIRFDYREFK